MCTWENLCAGWNGMEWSCWLLVDLSPLALLAVSAHGYQIFANTLWDKMCLYHTFGGLNAGVGNTVDCVENCRPISH